MKERNPNSIVLGVVFLIISVPLTIFFMWFSKETGLQGDILMWIFYSIPAMFSLGAIVILVRGTINQARCRQYRSALRKYYSHKKLDKFEESNYIWRYSAFGVNLARKTIYLDYDKVQFDEIIDAEIITQANYVGHTETSGNGNYSSSTYMGRSTIDAIGVRVFTDSVVNPYYTVWGDDAFSNEVYSTIKAILNKMKKKQI